MKPCAAGCECAMCLVPEHSAPRCTKHENCVGRDGHGGDRVGIRRGLRLALRELFKPTGQRT